MPDDFVAVAQVDDLPEGRGKEVRVGETLIALFRVGDRVYAIDAICPHRGGPLAEGPLEGTVVTCPWHAWQFDVATGQNLRNPASRVTCHEVRIEGNTVYVKVSS